MTRKQRLFIRMLKRNKDVLVLGFVTGTAIGLFIIPNIHFPKSAPIISPIPEAGQSGQIAPEATPTPTPEATTPYNAPQRPLIGKASYYSVAGCLGCSPTLTMANGERLDDSRLTLAYNHAPLNTRVKITNTVNGKTVVATITDRGGFERYGKIADLSVATRDALGCGDVCPISIEL